VQFKYRKSGRQASVLCILVQSLLFTERSMKYKTVALYKLSVNSLMKKIIVDAPNGFLGVLKMGAISPLASHASMLVI